MTDPDALSAWGKRARDEHPAAIVERKVREIALAKGPGARIPSVRTLIRVCNVSQAAVVEALDRLAQSGLIEKRPRSGIFVQNRPWRRPRLILVEPDIVVTPSPFGEMVLYELADQYSGPLTSLIVRFVLASWDPQSVSSPREMLSQEDWKKLEAGHYASVIAFGVDEMLVPMIEATGVPVIGFSCPARYLSQIPMHDLVRQGVEALVADGCQRIMLMDTPFAPISQIHALAQQVAGPGIELVPVHMGMVASNKHPVVRRYPYFEQGLAAAEILLRRKRDKGADGVLCMDDLFCHGLLVGMLRKGKSIADMPRIATYANRNSPVLAAYEDDLILIEFDPAALAKDLHEASDALESGTSLPSQWRPYRGPIINHRIELELEIRLHRR